MNELFMATTLAKGMLKAFGKQLPDEVVASVSGLITGMKINNVHEKLQEIWDKVKNHLNDSDVDKFKESVMQLYNQEGNLEHKPEFEEWIQRIQEARSIRDLDPANFDSYSQMNFGAENTTDTSGMNETEDNLEEDSDWVESLSDWF